MDVGLVNQINEHTKGTLMEALGMEFLDYCKGELKMKMPVDERTFQPMRFLHGGALMALAESAGSMLSYLETDRDKFHVFGTEIGASHLKSTRSGFVLAHARIIHRGRTSHVVEIQMYNEANDLVSTCRLTNRIVERK